MYGELVVDPDASPCESYQPRNSVPALEQYRGTLGTAEGLSAYLDEMTKGELAKLAANLDIYASTRYMLDVTDASAGQYKEMIRDRE